MPQNYAPEKNSGNIVANQECSIIPGCHWMRRRRRWPIWERHRRLISNMKLTSFINLSKTPTHYVSGRHYSPSSLYLSSIDDHSYGSLKLDNPFDQASTASVLLLDKEEFSSVSAVDSCIDL